MEKNGLVLGTKVRTMTAVEGAWLAAALDGEGSIGIYPKNKGSDQGRRVLIQVGNTHPGFVARVKEIVGGIGSDCTVPRKRSSRHRGDKPMYYYSLKGSLRCLMVLRQIEPYLIIKREKAQAIIQEITEQPFGRWKQITPESRKQQSDLIKKSWRISEIRAKRIKGMRSYYAKRKVS